MKYKIKTPSGVRYWPQSYLPEHRGEYYICPLDPETEGGENLCPWNVSTDGTLATEPWHDPVFLVLFDLVHVDIDLNSIEGIREYCGLLASIVTHDRRGYLGKVLGNITNVLKASASLHDWNRFLEEYRESKRDLLRVRGRLEDTDLSEEMARQHDGYRKIDAKGEKLIRKVLD